MALRSVFLLIDKFGTSRTLQRIDPPGPPTTVSVKTMMRRAQESPVIGDVSQEDTQAYVRHDALTAVGFPVPPVKGDRLIDASGRTYVVGTVEDMHDGQGNVGGYRLWMRGH